VIGDERSTVDLASERIRRWFDDVAAAEAALTAREDPDPVSPPGVG
jgi:hypothetical protein